MAGSFLDMQAYVGITKQIGGFPATKTLLPLCHIEDAREILEVGCGIGVGPAHAARTYGCRVVGIDLSERMIGWSRQRAREERVEDRIEFQVADLLALPFESDRFEAALCESVLAFVADKEKAIRELVRVTTPRRKAPPARPVFGREGPGRLVRPRYDIRPGRKRRGAPLGL